MNKQVALSIEQMKHLESLGLDTSDASMTYHQYTISNNGELTTDYDLISFSYNDCINNIADKSVLFPAYTLQDILNKLPEKIIRADDLTEEYVWKLELDCISYYNDLTFNHIKVCRHESLLDSAFKMLLWCIENNYIKTNKVCGIK